MRILVVYPQHITWVVVSVGSLLLFVNMVILFVNYNFPRLNLTVEYLEPVNGNQTKYLTEWQEISKQGQEILIKEVENVDNAAGFDAAFKRNGSEINGNPELRNCDLYHGKWIYDATGPLYTNSTCPILTLSQNCKRNGRPDNNYENWRWKPNQCKLPRFDGRKFLELTRGNTLAFVGDSLSRNQMESLLCILWQIEVPIRVTHLLIHKWYFKSTSTTIAGIWSAWLVQYTSLPIPFSSPRAGKVHLETPDASFMDFLPNCDVVVLSSGHWFTPEPVYVLNSTVIRRQLRRISRSRKKHKSDRSYGLTKQKTNTIKSYDRAKQKANLIKSNGTAKQKTNAIISDGIAKQKTNIIKSYGIALQTALNAIINLPNYSGLVLFRSYSPHHYVRGAWNMGGSCAAFDRPSGESVKSEHESAMFKKQVEEFERVTKKLRNNCKLRFMDIGEVSGYRRDGHLGPYTGHDGRKGPEDCVHWCMPGPVDTWNEILFQVLWREKSYE